MTGDRLEKANICYWRN